MQVLAVRRHQHVGRVRHPLDPFDALPLREADIGEGSDLLQARAGLGDITCLFLAEVRELLLEDVDGLVGLQRLLDSDTHRGQEIRQLVDLVVATARIPGQEVPGRVLGRLIHRTVPCRLASTCHDLPDCLHADVQLLAVERVVGVLLWPAVVQVLAGVAELARLSELKPRPGDHDLHERPHVLHREVRHLAMRRFRGIGDPLLAFPRKISNNNVLLGGVLVVLPGGALLFATELPLKGLDDLFTLRLVPGVLAVESFLRQAHDDFLAVGALGVEHQQDLRPREGRQVLLVWMPVRGDAHLFHLGDHAFLVHQHVGLELKSRERHVFVRVGLIHEAKGDVVLAIDEHAF
mmetsp:Transcript_28044/g.80574  ORF Transcript_28044/g.80574 Transcript_28044/m.80574 type:complete len:349 (-) Transcript_28044:542-1588(-)